MTVAWGRLDPLQQLIAADPDQLQCRDRRGSLLYHALMSNQLEIAKWLIAKGCDPRCSDEDLVFAAVRSRCEEPIRFAVKHGARVDGPANGRTALQHECNHGWTKLVGCLLELGADPNARDRPVTHGGTSLHLAAQRGSATKLVGLLLDAGADIHAKNDRGELALDIAKRARQPHVAKLLIKRGDE